MKKNLFKKRKLLQIGLAFGVIATPLVVTSCTVGKVGANLSETLYRGINAITTNDIHGRFDTESSSKAGLKYIAAYSENYNTDLMLDVGDMIQGTAMSNFDKGKSIIEIANMMKYDAMAVGNHEFDFGLENLINLDKASDMPFLAANIRYKESGQRLFESSVVKTIRGDLKVGIIGIATPETVTTTHPKNVVGLEFTDIVEETKDEIAKLKKQNINFITVLTHTGEELATELATKLGEDIDLIVDGHSHQNYEKKVNNTYIIQAGSNGNNLRHSYFDFNKETGHIESFLSKNVTSDELKKFDTVKDENITKNIDKLRESVKTEFEKVVVNNLPYELDASKKYSSEVNIGNLIADALYDGANESIKEGNKNNKTALAELDFAVMNTGGIRASIKQGVVKEQDLYNVCPFGNFLSVAEVPGQNIIDAFKKAITVKEDGSFNVMFHVSEQIKITYNADTKTFTYQIKDKNKTNFVDIDPNKTYKMATNDFIFAGGDNFTSLNVSTPENNITGYKTYGVDLDFFRKYFIKVYGTQGTENLQNKYKETKPTRLILNNQTTPAEKSN